MYHKPRKHIKIKVLLIPGTTIPIDIKKPDKIKNAKENSSEFTLFVRLNLLSRTTNKYPRINEITVKNKYRNLKVYSELTFFTSIGILPKISPIKQKLIWIGK